MNRPPAMSPGSVPYFYGRDEELGWLYGLLDNVADAKVPRLAVIVAESGIGKSALIQALYRKLTTDPRWDGPSPGGFWPDAFQGRDDDLKVNPDFPKGYQPGELPKFMWIGMRWKDPEDRNRLERGCPLPDARDALVRNVKVVLGMSGAGRRLLGRLRREGVALRRRGAEEASTLAAEAAAGVAFGPLVPFARIALGALRDVSNLRGVRHRDLEEAAKRSAGDELCRELGELMGGKEPLPTIVWLDDAQWIDKSSMEFLEKVFGQAKHGRWPLLVVATHWEREWREDLRRSSEDAPSLTRFANLEFDKNRRTETLVLKKGGRGALRSLLVERLRGLTVDQQNLIIDNSDGNFLSLVQNIGELLARPRNFENSDSGSPLTQGAMKRIEGWESKRDQRAEQRFRDLEDEIQDILGWSSRAGARFIREMIVEFAQGRIKNDSEDRISRCIDPYAILSGSEYRLMEFRDRAYYRSAMKHFEDFLRAIHEDDLGQFLMDWFSEWINRCFDDNGQILSPEYAPESSLLATHPAKRVELLEIVVGSLPLQEAPDWSEPTAAASLRAHCMLVEAYSYAMLREQCRMIGKSLENVDWTAVPTSVLSSGRRFGACRDLEDAGAVEAAKRLAESLLANDRKELEDADTLKSRLSLAASLQLLGRIEAQRGDLESACERFLEGLEIYPHHARHLPHPLESSMRAVEKKLRRQDPYRIPISRALEARRELETYRRSGRELDSTRVYVLLDNLGRIEEQRGELESARGWYSEALGVRRRLAEELGTPESRRDVSVSLVHLGGIEEQRGKLETAYERFSEALEIRRRLAEAAFSKYADNLLEALESEEGLESDEDDFDTYLRSRRDVAVSLDHLGGIEDKRSELESAHTRYSEALEIRRRLAEEVFEAPRHSEEDEHLSDFVEFDTLRSLRDVAVSLDHVGGIEEQRGELESAHTRFFEALEIRRRLTEDLDTFESRAHASFMVELDPRSCRDVSVSLNGLGTIEQKQGELESAYGRFTEALEIRRRLAQGFDTPQSRRNVSEMEEKIKAVQALMADANGE